MKIGQTVVADGGVPSEEIFKRDSEFLGDGIAGIPRDHFIPFVARINRASHGRPMRACKCRHGSCPSVMTLGDMIMVARRASNASNASGERKDGFDMHFGGQPGEGKHW